MSDLSSHRVVLWGVSAAGKTMLLSQLYDRQPSGGYDGWKIPPPRDPETIRFLEEARSRVRALNTFPMPSTDMPRPLVFRFVHAASGRAAMLHIDDRSGEAHDSTARIDPDKLLSDGPSSVATRADLLDRYQSADALVLLLDPSQDPGQLAARVDGALTRWGIVRDRKGSGAACPVAVCMSKADRVLDDEPDVAAARARPREIAERHGLDQTLRVIQRHGLTHEVFVLSSVGMKRRFGAARSLMFYDESLRPRIWPADDPIGIAAPFLWIFDQVAS